MIYIKEAVQLAPNYADAYNNLGSVHQEMGQINEALTCYQKAFQINQNFLEPCLNLIQIYKDKGAFEEALMYCRNIFKSNPCYPSIYQTLLYLLLMTGKLKEALIDSWDLLKIASSEKHQNISQPLCDGSDIQNKTILLHGGCFGDNIMYIRYAPIIAQNGAKIIYECHKDLLSLLEDTEGIHQFIVSDEPLPQFDFHCPILCLPMALNSTIESIPSKTPYIKANSLLTDKWKNTLKQDNSKLKVGIVWSAGHIASANLRVFPFELFSSLAHLHNISFYSLQKGEAAKQAKQPPEGLKFYDYTEEIKDFSDTAALIENLDLVISVDTSVAHLAGALGKPVWTLLNYSADWKWLDNRADSPWYPTMKLFRQSSQEDWESVITKIENELVTQFRDLLE